MEKKAGEYMPLVAANPRGLLNGNTITQFTDTTNTTSVTFTYPISQTNLIIENSGEHDIFVTVGNVTNQQVVKDTKWRYDGSFTSFDIRSDVNSQEFIATAIIQGLDDFTSINNQLNDVNSSLAQKAQQYVVDVVKDFGADPTGNTDSTTAIQNAINNAYANNKAIFFPPGHYVATSLVINDRATFIGSNRFWNSVYSSTKWECTLDLSGGFIGSTAGTASSYFQTTVNMRNLAIKGTGSNVLFQFMNLTASIITECMIYNFNYVISGIITDVTQIHHNRFINIATSVLSSRQGSVIGTMVDSSVHHNYLNGTSAGNSVLIDGQNINYSNISDNFFDYANTGLMLDSASTNNVVANNMFDVCYKGINVNSGSNISIIANRFGKVSKSNVGLFTNLSAGNQTTYSSNNWLGITLGGGINHIAIADNIGYQADVLVNIANYGINNITTHGNVNGYSSGVTVNMARTVDTNNKNDGKNIYIQELNNQVVSSLPALTACYVGMTVWYQGKLCGRKAGNFDTQALNITAGATTSGTVTVTLAGTAVNVSVSSGDSANAVASKIQAATYSLYTASLSGTTITFTCNTTGAHSAATFSGGSTGVTGTFTVTLAGSADYWTDTMGTTVS